VLPADPPPADDLDEFIRERAADSPDEALHYVNAELRARVARLTAALRRVLDANDGQCEKSTAGIGSCFRNGNDPDGADFVSRCCNACITHAALAGETTDTPRPPFLMSDAVPDADLNHAREGGARG
jgi:hypothetical protein